MYLSIVVLILLLISALAGFLIGYLLRKNKKSPCTQCPELEKEVAELKQQLAALKSQPVQQFFFDASRAREVFGLRISENDLKIVEGIGPKISAVKRSAMIYQIIILISALLFLDLPSEEEFDASGSVSDL